MNDACIYCFQNFWKPLPLRIIQPFDVTRQKPQTSDPSVWMIRSIGLKNTSVEMHMVMIDIVSSWQWSRRNCISCQLTEFTWRWYGVDCKFITVTYLVTMVTITSATNSCFIVYIFIFHRDQQNVFRKQKS